MGFSFFKKFLYSLPFVGGMAGDDEVEEGIDVLPKEELVEGSVSVSGEGSGSVEKVESGVSEGGSVDVEVQGASGEVSGVSEPVSGGAVDGGGVVVKAVERAVSLADLVAWLLGEKVGFSDVEVLTALFGGEFKDVVSKPPREVVNFLVERKVRGLFPGAQAVSSAGAVSSGVGAGAGSVLGSDVSLLTIPEAHVPEVWVAKCPVCLGEWSVPGAQVNFICPICGVEIKRGV